jgi:hypothetical protein
MNSVIVPFASPTKIPIISLLLGQLITFVQLKARTRSCYPNSAELFRNLRLRHLLHFARKDHKVLHGLHIVLCLSLCRICDNSTFLRSYSYDIQRSVSQMIQPMVCKSPIGSASRNSGGRIDTLEKQKSYASTLPHFILQKINLQHHSRPLCNFQKLNLFQDISPRIYPLE